MDAEAGGAALGMARAFRGPPVLAARLAHRPALLGRDVAAADAEAGGPAGLAAPAAALPAGAAPGLGIASAIRDPLGLRLGVTGAVAGAMLLGAGLAGRALGTRREPGRTWCRCRRPSARRAEQAAALALIALRAFWVAPRLALGPEPGGPGAESAARRFSAQGSQSVRSGAGSEPCRTSNITRPRGGLRCGGGIAPDRFCAFARCRGKPRRPPSCQSGNGRKDAPPAPGRQDVREGGVSPSACGRREGRPRSTPRPACRHGS